jgi:hypothetical protein
MDGGDLLFPVNDKNAANRRNLVVKNEQLVGSDLDRKPMVPSPAPPTSDDLLAPTRAAENKSTKSNPRFPTMS